jgi:hypothetical protein
MRTTEVRRHLLRCRENKKPVITNEQLGTSLGTELSASLEDLQDSESLLFSDGLAKEASGSMLVARRSQENLQGFTAIPRELASVSSISMQCPSNLDNMK